jgi:hypothetical protein
MLRPSRSFRSRWPVLALLLVGGFLALAAHADILMLRDGSQVQTRGPWKVQGPMVIFTTTDGQLASLQLKKVDLDASQAATAEAVRKAKEAAEKAKTKPTTEVKPVLVLTDADVAHVGPTGEAEAPNGAQQETAGSRIVVTSWQRVDTPNGEGVTISGRVTNQSQDVVGDITVTVDVYNADGQRLGSASTGVSPTSLLPGTNGNFRATLSDVPDFVSARFSVDSTALQSAEPSPATVPQIQYEQQQEEGTAPPEDEQPADEMAPDQQAPEEDTSQ